MQKPIIKENIGNTVVSKKSHTNKWWELPAEEVHESVIPYTSRLRQNQNSRRLQSIRFAKLYQNEMPTSLFGVSDTTAAFPNSRSTMSYNLIKSAIDTATAKLGRTRPRPMFLTEKGNSAQQRRAKLLTQYIDGVFDDLNIYEKGSSALRDSGIVGLGALKLSIDHAENKICCEKVVVDELIVDDNESIYGTPGQMHQIKYVFKDVLKHLYPQFQKQIDDAKPAFDDVTSDTEAREMVAVVESWKLKSGASTSDGFHAISIEGATLFHENYAKDYFPFVFFRWTERLTGFWGLGLAEELYGIQLEINKLLRTVQLAQHFIAVPRVMVNAATKMNTNQINNTVGSIVKYAGPEPKFVTAQAMSSEIYGYIQWLIQSGYEQIGISQLSATSKKPTGLDAAVALREYNDIETERFALVAQRYDKFYLDVAKIIIDLSRDLYTSSSKSIKYAGEKFLKQIKWSDVSLEDDQYIMRVYPTNILPTQPAAKLQKAVELMQGGIIQPEDFARLIDAPDLKSTMSAITASDDLIIDMLDSIVDDGEYSPPEPAMDPARAIKLSKLRYLEERRSGLDLDRLELLLKWNRRAEEIAQASMVPSMPMEQTPLAVPEPLPQTEMLPQVPTPLV